MLLEPTFLEKVWNKGVDIAAGIITSTISAGIIAVIATLTWRWKRKRDLAHEESKQRQQHRISQELQAHELAKSEQAKIARLKVELEPLIKGFASAANGPALAIAWSTYFNWLTRNNLQDLPKNQGLVQTWGHWPFNDEIQQNACKHAQDIARQLADTQL